MTFNVIVILILAVLLLAVLIFVFTTSSGSFLNNINSYFSDSNVDSIISNCNNLVSVNSFYEYCCIKKSVKTSKEEIFQLSCDETRLKDFGNRINKLECTGVCNG